MNKKTKRKKNRLEKLANKITYFRYSKDDKGKYLNYCTFHYHPGMLGENKAAECIERGCKYYRRYDEH